MQRVQPQLVVSDELGRSSNALSGNNQTAQARGPSPTGSSALLPSPSSSPRAASTLHLPPGPRFPLNPTASRSNTLVMGSPPRLPSPLASDDTLQLIQDEQSSDVRAFEPSRATRGSVRLLSRGPDSTSSSSSRTAASDAWIIPVYPFSESRGEAVQVTRPASENRTAAGVAESAEMNSATTRRTSAARASRTAFLQPGSAAASLLLGSGGGGGGMRDRLRLVDQESDAGRIVGNLRAAFLPHTVNIPPVPSERAQENPDLGDDESSAWLGPSRSRPLPNPSSGASTYASSSTLPAAGPLLTAGELDPNGENFDRSATRLPHHLGGYSIPGGDAEAILSEPSVWTPLPVLAPSTPSLVSPPHFSIETVPPSFGAPGFDRDSPEAQRRLERTSGLLEDLQQRRERLRYNIAALRAATAVDPPGDEALASVSNEREGPTVRVNNLRPPEQSTPAGSPARQHSSVSSRLLEALGGEGLGDIGRRLAREERENEVAGSLWDGWASYTGTSSWHADEPPDDLGVGVQASPPTAMTRADARDELQRTTSVLRPRFLHEGSPRANLEEHLRSAEQEDAARATRESLIVRAGRDHSTPGSRRNAPWLLGDGRPSTETRTGEEARFWVRSSVRLAARPFADIPLRARSPARRLRRRNAHLCQRRPLRLFLAS